MAWEKLQPEKKPFIGCLNCGGGEMIRENDGTIICNLDVSLYMDFGGWTVTKDEKRYYCADHEDECKTLREIEADAALDPDHDWRAIANLPLRDAEYQRQGQGRWVLVKTGGGFA